MDKYIENILKEKEFNSMITNKHIGKKYTGEEFNQIFPNIRLFKLTNKTEDHYNFKFKTGVNIDTNEFNPNDKCKRGGLYITEPINMCKWLNYNENGPMENIRIATILSDSTVYIEENKLKTDKVLLSDKILIHDLDLWHHYKWCFHAVSQNARALTYTKLCHHVTMHERSALLEEAAKHGYCNPSSYMELMDGDVYIPDKYPTPKINGQTKSLNLGIKKLRSRPRHGRMHFRNRFRRNNGIIMLGLGLVLLNFCKT
uniref:Uncharacterized protein n=1 Tax=Mimivirus LCMiAC01 TaxID=2506608 RepID=A0A481YZV7_9VIRU|nr:MAG: hypothetical protein LCMiAC01_03770 [Mimivirus LCMiAC01]